jgi:hypothetical protein
MELIEESAAARICEGFEDLVHLMQPNGCIFRSPRQIKLFDATKKQLLDRRCAQTYQVFFR